MWLPRAQAVQESAPSTKTPFYTVLNIVSKASLKRKEQKDPGFSRKLDGCNVD